MKDVRRDRVFHNYRLHTSRKARAARPKSNGASRRATLNLGVEATSRHFHMKELRRGRGVRARTGPAKPRDEELFSGPIGIIGRLRSGIRARITAGMTAGDAAGRGGRGRGGRQAATAVLFLSTRVSAWDTYRDE